MKILTMKILTAKNLSSILLGLSFWLLGGTAVQAKPLYMTVTRDFAPSERAVVELNYQNTAPIQLRVYAPKDLKGFVASQMDLRRAWKQPRAEFNPEHFLSLGYNASSFDVDWLRRGANVEMRKKLKNQLGGGEIKSEGSSLIPGPERIVIGPDGFQLVKELTVVPETEDTKRPFDVPGFNWWLGSGYAPFKTKVVELPQLASGFYVVQTLQGDSEGQVVVVINNLMAQFQQTTGAGLWRVVDRTGRPLEGARISVKNLDGKWVADGKTDSQGEYFNSTLKGTDLVSIIEHKGSVAVIDSEFFATTASFPDLYLYTDRPMYRIGDPVYFRGILRNREKDRADLLKSAKSVKVELQDLEGKPVGKPKDLKVSEFGTFSGQFQVVDSVEQGPFRVVARVSGAEHSADFRVKEYVKPLFFVTVQSDRETLKAGDQLVAHVKAERYAGGVPTGVRGSAQLFRVRMDSPQWVDDAGMGETGSVVTYGWDAGASPDSPNLPVLITETTVELDERGMGEVSLSVPKELPGPRNYDYQFKLVVSLQDADENWAGSTKMFSDLQAEVVAQARFSGVALASTDKQSLTIRSVTASGKPFPESSGAVEFWVESVGEAPRKLNQVDVKTNAQGRATVPLPILDFGNLVARVALRDKQGNSSSTEARVVVAGTSLADDKKSVVLTREAQILSNQSEVGPADTLKSLLLLPPGWGVGAKNEGQIFVTVAGRQIYDRKRLPVNGNSVWLEEKIKPEYGTSVSLVVSYPDSRQGWVERRSTYRIVDPGKKVQVKIEPLDMLVAPGGSQELTLKAQSWDGKPLVTELSVAVVDRSVLDIQPEIRPGLIEFFYPADRLNLSTFLSGQFQSYGYAERIARLFKSNFGFAASKSASQALDQVDTAFWSGQVRTNEQGEAKVTFAMPGNQTIWKVIVIAADAEGRFGEGQTEFKSQMPVSILLGYPAFLRSGDKSQMRVNLTSQASRPIKVRYKLQSETPAQVAMNSPLNFEGTLSAKEQKTLDSEIVAKDSGEVKAGGDNKAAGSAKVTAGFLGQIELGQKPLRFRDRLDVLPGTLVQKQFLLPNKQDEFSFEIGANERLKALELHVNSGLLATLLPSLRWLVHYPYGCVEQTLSSLIPNLVFADVLTEAAKGKIVLSKEETQILDDAKAFSKAGLQRLQAFKGKDGGFRWWTGEANGDRTMTLLVLTLLAASEDGVVSLYGYSDSLAWIKTQGIVPASAEGILLSYIDARFAARWVGVRNSDVVKATLKLQAEYALKSGTLLDQSWLLLAIKSQQNAGTEFDSIKSQLTGAIRSQLDREQGGKLGPVPSGLGVEIFPGYPGRAGSTVAVAVRALTPPKVTAAAQEYSKYGELLLKNFNGESFGSTWETSLSLIMLTPFLKAEIGAVKAQANYDVKVSEGKVTGLEKAAGKSPRLGGITYHLKPQTLSSGAKHSLKISGVPAQATARMTVSLEAPMGRAGAAKRGWDVTREYYRLGPKGEKERIEPTKTVLSVGDLVWVRVIFQRQKDFSGWRSRYYLVSDHVPAGFTVVEEDRVYDAAPYQLGLKGAYRSRSLERDRVRWYYDFTRGWMDREVLTGYVMRAAYPGKFVAGVAQVEDFYDEQNTSQSQAASFEIRSTRGN